MRALAMIRRGQLNCSGKMKCQLLRMDTLDMSVIIVVKLVIVEKIVVSWIQDGTSSGQGCGTGKKYTKEVGTEMEYGVRNTERIIVQMGTPMCAGRESGVESEVGG